MKKLLLLSLSCAMLLLGGCKDPEPTPSVEQAEIAYNLNSPSYLSVDLALSSMNYDEIAYLAVSGSSSTPTADELFNNEMATIVAITDGANTIKIDDLESETAYTLYVAAKGESAGYGEVWSRTFTTTAFTQLLTILPADDMFSVKFHIDVPADCTINYAVIPRDQYHEQTNGFGFVDATFLSGHEGNATSSPTLKLLTEPTTVKFNGWGDPSVPDEFLHVTGGESLQLVIGEVAYAGNDVYDRRTYRAKYDFAGHTASAGDPDEYWETEYWSSQLINSKAPEIVAGIEAKVQITNHTTKTIAFGITPHDDMRGIAYAAYDKPGYDYIKSVLGSDEGVLNFHINKSYKHETTDAFSYEFTGFIDGVDDYMLIIVGNLSGDGSKISYQEIEFSPAVATMEAPEMLVTGIDAPDGEVASPWEVWFNIKAVNGDAESVKYLMNDAREFTYLLNGGVNYYSLMSQYGNSITDFDALDAINSSEGYNIMFPAWEDTESRLVVAGINAEEVMTNPDENPGCIANKRTAVIEPLTPVTSDLFNSLQGEWYVEAYATSFLNESGETLDEPLISTTPITFPVKITYGAPEYPETLTQSVYDAYLNSDPTMTKDKVDDLFEEFKELSPIFASKVKGQNRLLIEGFMADPDHYANVFEYNSPYDLFGSTEYSQAVTVNDLFYDFGPKWYIQVKENDELVIPVDLSRIPPMVNTFSRIYHYGVAVDGLTYASELKEFPVTISEDGNTLTVEQALYTVDNKNYFFTVGEIDSYGQAKASIVCGKLLIKRGGLKATPAVKTPSYAPMRSVDNYIPVKSYRGTSLKGATIYTKGISSDKVMTLKAAPYAIQ